MFGLIEASDTQCFCTGPEICKNKKNKNRIRETINNLNNKKINLEQKKDKNNGDLKNLESIQRDIDKYTTLLNLTSISEEYKGDESEEKDGIKIQLGRCEAKIEDDSDCNKLRDYNKFFSTDDNLKKLAENGTDFKLRVGSCYADCPDKFTDLGTECIKPDNINDYPPNKTTVWTPNYFGNYLVPQCGLTWENNKWIPHEGYTDCIKNNNGIPTYKVYKSRLMGCPGIDFAGAYQNKSRKNCENM